MYGTVVDSVSNVRLCSSGRKRSVVPLYSCTAQRVTHSRACQAIDAVGSIDVAFRLVAGGHTSEMLKLTSHLSPETYAPLYYVVASTDHTSAQRIPPEGIPSGRCKVRKIPRSREVRAR